MSETRIVLDEVIVVSRDSARRNRPDLEHHVRLVLKGQVAEGDLVGSHVRIELPITEVTGRIDITSS